MAKKAVKKEGEEEEKKLSPFEQKMADMEKLYGKGSVMSFGQKADDDYDAVSTGSIGFDIGLGTGGWVKSKIYELKGWEGTGKTTICGHAAQGFQAKYPDKKVLYIDGEHALDKNYFKALGVNVDEMLICQPDYGEMGFNVAENLIDSGEISLVIIDSNTSLIPKKVIDGQAGDGAIGLQARLNSNEWPKIKNKLIKQGTTVIAINQFREKIGVMFGNPVTTNGGHALKFYSDVVMEVSRSVDKEGEGNKTKVKITKNKMSPPFVETEFFIKWGEGIDKIQEIIDLGEKVKMYRVRGKVINILNERGEEEKNDLLEFKQLLVDTQEFYEIEKEKVMEKLKTFVQPVEDKKEEK